MRRAYTHLQAGELEAASALLSEDFTAHIPGLAQPLQGRQIWQAGAQQMVEAFTDLTVHVEHALACDDQVAVRVRMSGTHTGSFQGVPATGRSVGFPSLEWYRIQDGRIAEEWVAPDMALLMSQISTDH